MFDANRIRLDWVLSDTMITDLDIDCWADDRLCEKLIEYMDDLNALDFEIASSLLCAETYMQMKPLVLQRHGITRADFSARWKVIKSKLSSIILYHVRRVE